MIDTEILRDEVVNHTAHHSRTSKFKAGQVIREIEEFAKIKLSKGRLKRMRDSALVNPKRTPKGHYIYSLDDLRDLLFFWKLHNKYDFTYFQAACCLLSDAKNKVEELLSEHAPKGWVTSPPDQIERAHMYWRSHLITVFLVWLFDGSFPSNIRLLIRRRGKTARVKTNGIGKIILHKSSFLDVDELLDPLTNDLTVFTTNDGEVLHKPIDYDEWKDCHNEGFEWYHIRGINSSTSTEINIVMSVPPGDRSRELRKLSDQLDARIFHLLIDACFSEVDSLSDTNNENEHFSDRVHTLVNLIPELSDKWEFCAVLVPQVEDPEILISTASNMDRKIPNIRIGQLLSGWAYQNNQMVVVQNDQLEQDPRVVEETNFRAAIAIPTTVLGNPNGALYVSTRHEVETKVFTSAESKMLRVFGLVIGELIEYEHLRLSTGISAVEILDEPFIIEKPWEELPKELEQVLNLLSRDEVAQNSDDNLHLVSCQIANFSKIEKRSPLIAEWVSKQVRFIANQYYLQQGLGIPTIFNYSPAEFTIMLNRISMNDDDEQDFRKEFNKWLNTLEIYSRTKRLKICLEFRSLQFRYSNLANRINDIDQGIQKSVIRLSTAVEKAFATLPFINQAHIYERQGSFVKAIEEMMKAYYLDQDNDYIWRHLGKYHTETGEYDEAISWWNKVLHDHDHPSYYRHLAYNYACKCDFESSSVYYEKAICFNNQDAKCYEGWGNVLLFKGEYEDAIEKYYKAATYDPENGEKYMLRIVELFLTLGKYREAHRARIRALTYDPKNLDSRLWAIKLSKAVEEENMKPVSNNTDGA